MGKLLEITSSNSDRYIDANRFVNPMNMVDTSLLYASCVFLSHNAPGSFEPKQCFEMYVTDVTVKQSLLVIRLDLPLAEGWQKG